MRNLLLTLTPSHDPNLAPSHVTYRTAAGREHAASSFSGLDLPNVAMAGLGYAIADRHRRPSSVKQLDFGCGSRGIFQLFAIGYELLICR